MQQHGASQVSSATRTKDKRSACISTQKGPESSPFLVFSSVAHLIPSYGMCAQSGEIHFIATACFTLFQMLPLRTSVCLTLSSILLCKEASLRVNIATALLPVASSRLRCDSQNFRASKTTFGKMRNGRRKKGAYHIILLLL